MSTSVLDVPIFLNFGKASYNKQTTANFRQIRPSSEEGDAVFKQLVTDGYTRRHTLTTDKRQVQVLTLCIAQVSSKPKEAKFVGRHIGIFNYCCSALHRKSKTLDEAKQILFVSPVVKDRLGHLVNFFCYFIIFSSLISNKQTTIVWSFL